MNMAVNNKVCRPLITVVAILPHGADGSRLDTDFDEPCKVRHE